MSDTVLLTMHGVPQQKERARRGAGGRWYTPAATVAAENRLTAVWQRLYPERTPWPGPISLDIRLDFTPPPSWPQWRREAAIRESWPHTVKPDADNLAKIIDALNGLAWVDDAQVWATHVTKRYATVPRTVIEITFHPPLPRTLNPRPASTSKDTA